MVNFRSKFLKVVEISVKITFCNFGKCNNCSCYLWTCPLVLLNHTYYNIYFALTMWTCWTFYYQFYFAIQWLLLYAVNSEISWPCEQVEIMAEWKWRHKIKTFYLSILFCMELLLFFLAFIMVKECFKQMDWNFIQLYQNYWYKWHTCTNSGNFGPATSMTLECHFSKWQLCFLNQSTLFM